MLAGNQGEIRWGIRRIDDGDWIPDKRALAFLADPRGARCGSVAGSGNIFPAFHGRVNAGLLL